MNNYYTSSEGVTSSHLVSSYTQHVHVPLSTPLLSNKPPLNHSLSLFTLFISFLPFHQISRGQLACDVAGYTLMAERTGISVMSPKGSLWVASRNPRVFSCSTSRKHEAAARFVTPLVTSSKEIDTCWANCC